MAILNPVVWTWDRFKLASSSLGSARAGEYWQDADRRARPAIARLELADLRIALMRGLGDLGTTRTDIVFLCAVYPLLGLLLGRLASGYGLLPLLFPLASGFALLGPLASLGLYEMSRRREQGLLIAWTDVFGVLRSPSIGSIAVLGTLLVGMFMLWLLAARAIYEWTLGPQPPASLSSFLHDVLATHPGWAMIVLGVGVGFLFAVAVLAISVISFPLLLDGHFGVGAAVRLSVRVVAANPRVMAAWGLIVATGLVIGSVPLLLGLAVVIPLLGHATWHLYRRALPRLPEPE